MLLAPPDRQLSVTNDSKRQDKSIMRKIFLSLIAGALGLSLSACSSPTSPSSTGLGSQLSNGRTAGQPSFREVPVDPNARELNVYVSKSNNKEKDKPKDDKTKPDDKKSGDNNAQSNGNSQTD